MRLRLVSVLLLAVVGTNLHRAPRAELQQERAVFPIQADGANARVSKQWMLRRADGSGLGLIVSAVRCGDAMFLADSEYRVYAFDLRRQAPVRELASDPAVLGLPLAVTADCVHHRLYVVTSGSRLVVTVDAQSGVIEHTQSVPRNISFPQGVHLVWPDTVWVSGVFNPTPDVSPYQTRQPDDFFQLLRLGIRVSLGTGAVSPLFQPYERRCIAAGECVTSNFDRLSGSSEPQWIVEQAISTRFALYSGNGRLASTHSTMSPRFVRDGTELPLGSSATIRLGWLNHNTTIRSVFGVGGLIVVVHAAFEGSPGEPADNVPIARPFMNIHDLDGRPLVSDIRLSNLPVGRDDSNLYVVGRAEDRRGPGGSEQQLMQIPIKRGHQSF